MPEPPERLYLWGTLPPPPYVAIVGSRSCTEDAVKFVQDMAGQLGRAGVTVISGGALGIDAAAHEGALAAGTPTLVIAPAGFRHAFPPENKGLFERILEQGGGYLSLDADKSDRGRFFPRNEVLAALADVLVIGEANARSGSRNAARHARSLGRAVFAVPAAGWNTKGWGSNAELRMGARWAERTQDVLRYLIETGRLVTDLAQRRNVAAESVAHLSQLPRPKVRPKEPAAQLRLGETQELTVPSELTRVRQALLEGARTPDAICESTGISARGVQVALFELTLRGEAGVDPGGALRLLLR